MWNVMWVLHFAFLKINHGVRDKATMLGTGHSPDACGLELVLSHMCLIYSLVIVAAQFFHRVRSRCKMHLIPVLSHHESKPIGQPHFIKWLNGMQVFSFEISIHNKWLGVFPAWSSYYCQGYFGIEQHSLIEGFIPWQGHINPRLRTSRAK
jgi:hypothetical protein